MFPQGENPSLDSPVNSKGRFGDVARVGKHTTSKSVDPVVILRSGQNCSREHIDFDRGPGLARSESQVQFALARDEATSPDHRPDRRGLCIKGNQGRIKALQGVRKQIASQLGLLLKVGVQRCMNP